MCTETYNEIYERMKNSYIAESGCEFDEASDIAIRLRVLAGEIYNAETSMEWLKRQMFATTAEGEYLDYIAEQRGLVRKKPQKAVGTLTFIIDEPKTYAIAVPKGTVVATHGEVPVRLITTEAGEIAVNETRVEIPAEAETEGFSGNVGLKTATVSVNVPAGIDSVTNLSLFTGGYDGESDSTFRERIRESYLVQPNGMNKAYYARLAMSVDGVLKAGVVEKYAGAGTLGLFVCGSGGDVSDEVLEKVAALLMENRGVNVSASAHNASARKYDLEVKVTARLDYSAAEVKEKIKNAFIDYLGAINIGGTVYLSTLGKYMLDTDCITSYEFSEYMQNLTLPGSQYFVPGEIEITVI